MMQFPFPRMSTSLKIFRILVPIFMFIHGISRIVHGAVGGFGEFLNSHGLPLGLYFAWGITIFEILGSLSLMAGYFVFVIAMTFVIELTVGITLVHSANGWFVVTYAREHKLKVIALCPYVSVQFKRHPQKYADIWNQHWHEKSEE